MNNNKLIKFIWQHYNQYHQIKNTKRINRCQKRLPKGGCPVEGSLLIIVKFEVTPQKLTWGKNKKKRKNGTSGKKISPERFGGFQCACETVRAHVLSILGTDTLQCIKTAGKNRK